MTLFWVSLFLAAAVFVMHLRVSQRMSVPRRVIHALVSLAILPLLFPVLLNWRKSTEVSEEQITKGMILTDSSASMLRDGELVGEVKSLIERVEAEPFVETEVLSFSDGAFSPYGDSAPGGGTDLAQSLEDFGGLFRTEAPDWIWVVTDGAFPVPEDLPEELQGVRKYVTLAERKVRSDFGIYNLMTDPVWYVRTDAPVRARVFRTKESGAVSVDVLCWIDGKLESTTRVEFLEGETEKTVEFVAASPHLGNALVEVALAEGQGGDLPENDRQMLSVDVLRDRVRVMRVVGRPSWDSKFLRDYLRRREDTDLIDFHILRSMFDRVKAGPQELALIPFPVEELFEENIKSFDLIIWMDFNFNSYAFFKPSYFQNIREFVREGGAFLHFAGKLDWNLHEGELKEIAAFRSSGKVHRLEKGRISVSPAGRRILGEDLSGGLESTGEIEWDMFSGERAEGAFPLLRFAGKDLLTVMEAGEGRAATVQTDQTWRLRFDESFGRRELYEGLMDRLMLWLQKHPSLAGTQFGLPGVVTADTFTEASFDTLSENGDTLIWEAVDDSRSLRTEIPPGETNLRVKAPKVPGVYRARLESGGGSRMVGVRLPPSEFLPEKERELRLKRLERKGFTRVSFDAEPWEVDVRQKAESRTSSRPWHDSPWWLATLIALLCAHWYLCAGTGSSRTNGRGKETS